MGGLGIRWTIGDVPEAGFDLLRLSIIGARRLFGPATRYVVVVHDLSPEVARARAGELPAGIAFVGARGVPDFLVPSLDADMAGGLAWRLAPPRVFPDAHELVLDAACVLWALPEGVREWLAGAPSAVLGEGVRPGGGRFRPLCTSGASHAALRGVPPRFDLGAALAEAIRAAPGPLSTADDEQGLEIAALERALPVHLVRAGEVALWYSDADEPFRPGRCGALLAAPGALAAVGEDVRSVLAEVERRLGLHAHPELDRAADAAAAREDVAPV